MSSIVPTDSSLRADGAPAQRNSQYPSCSSERALILRRQPLADVPLVHLAVIPAVAIPVRPMAWAVGTLPTATGCALATVDHLLPEEPPVTIVQAVILRLRYG